MQPGSRDDPFRLGSRRRQLAHGDGDVPRVTATRLQVGKNYKIGKKMMATRSACRSSRRPDGSVELDQLLAEILALEQGDESLRGVLDAVDDRFAVPELAFCVIAHQRLERLAVAILPVEYDHALHFDAVDEQRAERLVAIGHRRAVLGDEPAHDDPREPVHEPERRVEDLAADVLEVDVDAFRAGLAQVIEESPCLVIDAGIEAELLHHVIALRLAAGDADRAASFYLCELPDHAADRSGCGRYEDRLACFRLTDLGQAEPRGDSGHAEKSKVIGHRRALDVDRRELAAFRHAVELPAELREHLVPRLEPRFL